MNGDQNYKISILSTYVQCDLSAYKTKEKLSIFCTSVLIKFI